MADFVVDTNVLITATEAAQGGVAPRKMAARGEVVEIQDPATQRKVYEWVKAFRADSEALLVLDMPVSNIHKEYGNKLCDYEYGRIVAAEKLQNWQIRPAVGIEFVDNGNERVARLPAHLEAVIGDVSDRKMVAAALATGAPIINASDTDWYDWEDVLKEAGVDVIHLVPEYSKAKWKAKKAERR
jgi:hypothetical protein